ncbi:hypothetical protein DF268_33235, partial [Streptomyces sp. V2]
MTLVAVRRIVHRVGANVGVGSGGGAVGRGRMWMTVPWGGVIDVGFRIFFLMMRGPPRSTPRPSSAASEVYRRQAVLQALGASLLLVTVALAVAAITAALVCAPTLRRGARRTLAG